MSKVHHLEYCGMPGSGPTVKEAKQDAARKLERLVNDSSKDPVVVACGSYASLVWRSAYGWCSSLISSPDGFYKRLSPCYYGSTSTRDEVIENARQHVAQLAWTPEVEDDVLFASAAGITAGRLVEFLSWVAFQRRYKRAIALGLNDNDAREVAGGMMPMPEVRPNHYAGGERTDDGWSRPSPEDEAAYREQQVEDDLGYADWLEADTIPA
jgi:hypothetical protein